MLNATIWCQFHIFHLQHFNVYFIFFLYFVVVPLLFLLFVLLKYSKSKRSKFIVLSDNLWSTLNEKHSETKETRGNRREKKNYTAGRMLTHTCLQSVFFVFVFLFHNIVLVFLVMLSYYLFG